VVAPPLVEVQEQLPLEPSAARQARSLLEPFRDLLSEDAFDALRLLSSELVANCVQHGGGQGAITVDVRWLEDHVRIRVGCATGAVRPAIVDPGYRHGGGGLGLRIVDRVAREWGVEEEGATTWVWAAIALEP